MSTYVHDLKDGQRIRVLTSYPPLWFAGWTGTIVDARRGMVRFDHAKTPEAASNEWVRHELKYPCSPTQCVWNVGIAVEVLGADADFADVDEGGIV